MTYCVGMLLESGLVFASDSRTNAGVDHIAAYRKMTVYERPGDRVIVILSSGNLSMTQGVINLLQKEKSKGHKYESIWQVATMFEAAQLVGHAIRKVHDTDGTFLKQVGEEFNVSFIVVVSQKVQIFRF